MKKTAIAFGLFFVLLVAGVTTCVPGICGCAVSWVPYKYQSAINGAALAADVVGLAGCAVTGFLFLVLITRRAAMRDGQTAREGRTH
jgi:hypothetical protein